MTTKTESTEEKAIQDTSEEVVPTTSEGLFGKDFNLTPVELESIERKRENEIPEEAPTEVEAEATTEEPLTTKTEEVERKYLSLEDLDNTYFKTKVDGEEKEVVAKDVLRSYQTDKSLTQKGQKIAEQYRELEKAKDSLIAQPKPEVTAGTEEDGYNTDYTAPSRPKDSSPDRTG